MVASAALMGTVGAALLFSPLATAGLLGLGANPGNASALTLVGALCFAFAFLDWNGRSAIYGGIYGRPIAMANLFASTFVALELARVQMSRPSPSSTQAVVGWSVTALFFAAAIAFIGVVFHRPWIRTDAP